MTTKVTFLGLGAMGSRMALRLSESDFDVTVYNRSSGPADVLKTRSVNVAPTPAKAADGADIIISMVTDIDASRAVWLGERGAMSAVKPGAIVVESSTVTPAWIQELGEHVARAKARFLDAPVAGSRPQAEAGILAFLVGGDSETLEEARPVLTVMGKTQLHVGDVGAGTAFKLAVNAYFATQVAAISELYGMLVNSGVQLQKATELMSALPITSPALQGVSGAIAAKNFAPLFPIALVEKDLRYATEFASTVGAQLPIAHQVRNVFHRAIEEGHGDDNIAGVAQLFVHGF